MKKFLYFSLSLAFSLSIVAHVSSDEAKIIFEEASEREEKLVKEVRAKQIMYHVSQKPGYVQHEISLNDIDRFQYFCNMLSPKMVHKFLEGIHAASYSEEGQQKTLTSSEVIAEIEKIKEELTQREVVCTPSCCVVLDWLTQELNLTQKKLEKLKEWEKLLNNEDKGEKVAC